MSTAAPSTISGIEAASGYTQSYPSQDSYPFEFSEATAYVDPVQDAKQKLKKLEKKDKKKAQSRKDAKTAAEWLLFLGVFNALMWVIPLFGNGWHKRMFNGFAVGFTRVFCSLFSLEVIVECKAMDWPFGISSDFMAKLSPEHQLCKIFHHMSGTHSMHSAKDLACAVSTQSCNLMESIWYSNFFLIFAFAVNALLSFVAAMFLYYYWYQEHLKKIRQWAMALYFASPALGIIAFAMYNIVVPDIGGLPRAWTSVVQGINFGTGAGEIRAIGEDTFFNRYGWCWFFVYITIFFSLFAPVSWGLWFKPHPDEKSHELAATNEKLEIEEAIMELEEKQDYVENGGLAEIPGACPAQQYPEYPGMYQSSDAYAGAYTPQSGYGYGAGAGYGYGQSPY